MKKLTISGLVIFVVFFLAATLVWFVHDKDIYKRLKYNETFHQSSISKLNIDSYSSDITITQGSSFRVKYYGDNSIKVNTQKDSLNVKESRSSKRGYSFNLNPFKRSKFNIHITIPPDTLKQLNIDAKLGKLNINNIDIKKARIRKDGENLNIKEAKLDRIDYYSNHGTINIKNSDIKNSQFKVINSNIVVNHCTLKNGLFITNEGKLDFKNMPSQIDMKSSSKKGDINIEYKTKPKDTLLKLHPGMGDNNIKNPYFKDSKVGNSYNIIECYNVKGDINIK